MVASVPILAVPILATKLYIPPPPPKVVLRTRLIERLREGLHRKLTLISAPAGFGKTTPVSEWAATLTPSAVGVWAVTTREWLKMACNADGENLHEAIHNQSGYRGISAPATLSHRYGVSVRVMESIIRLACIIHRTDYWLWGRTLERLGIEHLSVSELTRYVNVKTKHQMPIYTRRPKLTPISVTHVEQARKINGRRLLEKAPLPTEVDSFSETTTTKD